MEGGTSLKFSVISTDRHIASIHARLNTDQAVALMRGTKLALRPDAGEEEGARHHPRPRRAPGDILDGARTGYVKP